MPTITRDHVGTYAATDIDPPCWDEPEPDAGLLADCKAEGEEQAEADFANGIEDNPFSRWENDYETARWEGWFSRTYDLRKAYDAAGETCEEIIIPKVAI